MRRALLTLAVSLALTAPAGGARAQAPGLTEAQKSDVRERFDRALSRFNDGDNAGALAELNRVYQLVPSPTVLYNIGLVQAAMGRAVEATDALDKLLAAPGALSRERLDHARATRDEQAKRVAVLSVTCSVDEAFVEIDGLDAGPAPVKARRLVSGSHVVGCVRPGFTPLRREVILAAGVPAETRIELVASEGTLAHLTVRSNVPAADVLVDDALAGRTPLPASLAFSPGKHRLTVRRAGYVTATRDLKLDPGASGQEDLPLEEDASALAVEGGTLVLKISEPGAEVTLDGKPRGVYAGGIEVPAGLHELKVERGGFRAHLRPVTVPRGGALTLPIVLEPTPDLRAGYERDAEARRVWAWVTLGASIAVAGTGAIVVATGISGRRQDQAQYDAAHAARQQPAAPRCDLYAGGNDAKCAAAEQAAVNKLNGDIHRANAGWITTGVGGGLLAVAAVLFFTAPDPARYRRAPRHDDPLARVQPSVWLGAREGGAGVRLSF